MQRPNLVVRVGAHVTRVLLDGNRAAGVSYVQNGTETIAHAASEVLLSGGVINSPQLLLLSGIGPADQLRAQGIDVVADVPGVGENLHDHTMVPLVWATQHSNDLLEMASPENIALWQGGHGGPLPPTAPKSGLRVHRRPRRAQCAIDRRTNRVRRPRPDQPATAELHHVDGIDAPAQPWPAMVAVA
jgi:choline dehydrogenase